MNATLTLKEVGTDTVILSYKDENPLKLLYFFVRSSKPALWKIHESEIYNIISLHLMQYKFSRPISVQ